MNGTFEVSASSFLSWLVLCSLQVSLLILVVLGIQKALGRRLEPRWQCAMWLVVLLRMMLPWAPESRLSIHNQWARWIPAAQKANVESVLPVDSASPAIANELDVANAAPGTEESATIAKAKSAVQKSSGVSSLPFYRESWFWLSAWLTGASLMAVSLVWHQIAFWRAVKGCRPVTDSDTLNLLEDCKERMGVQTLLAIVPAPRMQTPALYGVIRPRLLVPPAMLTQLPREQLRYVLLHELAHLKRMDLHVGWLAAVLQMVHWFNPLVWIALSRMRLARELACDDKVLSVLHPDESPSYGQTILNILEYWTRPRRIPGMAGILEERSQLRRRITMIANHKSRRTMGTTATLALGSVLVLVGLTNAQTPSTVTNDKPTPQAKSAAAPAPEVVVRYDDDKSDGKWSLATSGHGIEFKRPANARFIEAVEMFGSRYGTDEAPKEFFHVYILNQDRQILADVPFAYGLIEKGDARWYRLRTPSVEVPESFMIAFSFDPHQTKGIYLHYANTDKPHSYTGLPDDGYEPVDKKYDWMVRAIMSETPSGQKGTKLLKDWKPRKTAGPFGDCVAIPSKAEPTQDKQSYGGQGPAIELTVDPTKIGSGKLPPDQIMVKGFSLYASRYGAGFNPQTTNVHVMVLDSDKEVRWQGEVPYASFNFKPQWVNVILPEPKPLSELADKDNKLTLAFDPEAHQTKGIYFHYQKNPEKSHSLAGTLGRGFRAVTDREWLMRIHVQPRMESGGTK